MEYTNPSKRIRDAIVDSGTIKPGNTVIVGVSGGPDSLCLIHALAELSDPMNLKLVAVHVNHMLRGEKSFEEAERVAEFCERNEIECNVFDIDCNEFAKKLGVSCEEAGRIARYEIFDVVADNIECDDDNKRIAVAHNADDQAETVLFRLIRGTGTHGIGGIERCRISEAGYEIVRPLLDVSRSDIEAYIDANKLHPNIDESNSVADVSRNKIRLELIPYLEKNFNPNIKEALRRYAHMSREEDELLTDIAIECSDDFVTVDEEREAVVLNNVRALRTLENPLLSRVVFEAMSLIGIDNGISYEHISAVMRLIRGTNPSAAIDLPCGMTAAREYDSLVIGPKDKIKPGKPDVTDKYELSIRIIGKEELDSASDGVQCAAFDFDAFNAVHPGKAGSICLRTRREGDYIAIKGGRKKLQDYMTDSKIKKADRDNVLLVAIGSEILWIVTTRRYSHNYHVNKETERILFLELAESI